METFNDVILDDQLVLTSSSSFLQGIVKRAFLCSCFVHRLVDFFATWCQPCKIMHPILEQVKEVPSDRIRIIKVNVDKYGVTANRYGKPCRMMRP